MRLAGHRGWGGSSCLSLTPPQPVPGDGCQPEAPVANRNKPWLGQRMGGGHSRAGQGPGRCLAGSAGAVWSWPSSLPSLSLSSSSEVSPSTSTFPSLCELNAPPCSPGALRLSCGCLGKAPILPWGSRGALRISPSNRFPPSLASQSRRWRGQKVVGVDSVQLLPCKGGGGQGSEDWTPDLQLSPRASGFHRWGWGSFMSQH